MLNRTYDHHLFAPGDTIVMKLVDDKIAFEKKAKRTKKEQPPEQQLEEIQ